MIRHRESIISNNSLVKIEFFLLKIIAVNLLIMQCLCLGNNFRDHIFEKKMTAHAAFQGYLNLIYVKPITQAFCKTTDYKKTGSLLRVINDIK